MSGKSRAGSLDNATRASMDRPSSDVVIGNPIDVERGGARILGLERLTFDGYAIVWHGPGGVSFDAFSGVANESAKESVPDVGPTPQGLFTVDPAKIEELVPSDDWGRFRVRIDPLRVTVDRMSNCFGVIRTGMYIHGGNVLGTKGCIELNKDSDEEAFFTRLKKYGKPIELEVKYAGAREKKYEEGKCPY